MRLGLLVCVFICWLVPGANAAANTNPNNEESPNIVWIMSEDNSKHYLKHFDPMGAEAPNIEALAREGITFDRAFSCGAVCSVARTTLITGVYAPRLGTQFHRRIKLATMPDDWKMFPAYLRDVGYFTSNNSKKDYNAVEGEGVWDESSNKATWKNRAENQPFFHVQTFTQSHEGQLHFKQQWADNPDNRTSTESVQLAPYHPDTPLFRLTYAHYHDRMRTIDDCVGEVVAALKEDGVYDNTIIFYFGDHGGVLPRGKGYIYESGLHVPLVVRVPEKWKSATEFAAGDRTNGFVEFVDFAPTVLKMAGCQIPAHLDGQAFLGNGIKKEAFEKRNVALGYVDRMDEKYDFCRSLRVGKWKYIRNYQAIYPDGLRNNYRYEMLAYRQWQKLFNESKLDEVQSAFFQPKPAEMLFNLNVDPFETNNLAANSEHQELKASLQKRLNQRLKSMPDLSFIPESDLVDDALEAPIKYGQQHKSEIAELVDVADLAVNDFADSKTQLAAAIDSDHRWKRYWAYSVCSIFGEQAAEFYSVAKVAAKEDQDPLVRLKAAEFLGVTNQADPVPVIRSILAESDSATLNLIALQSLVFFKDGSFDFETEIDTTMIRARNQEVIRRIGYLEGLTLKEMKKLMRRKK